MNQHADLLEGSRADVTAELRRIASVWRITHTNMVVVDTNVHGSARYSVLVVFEDSLPR